MKNIKKTLYSFFDLATRSVWVMLIASLTSGCWVGIKTVSVPKAAELQSPIFTDRDVYFDVCDSGNKSIYTSDLQERWSKIVKSVLERDFGIKAHQGPPPANKQSIYFLVTPKIYDARNVTGLPGILQLSSMAISMLSLSIIPGYISEESFIDIQFASINSDDAVIEDAYTYSYGVRYYAWLPFIFNPDFSLGINGGYDNKEKVAPKNAPELVIQRFMLDASEKIGKHTKDSKGVYSQSLLKCPN
jgi:hypothetical protein